jgi:hypothetical protein
MPTDSQRKREVLALAAQHGDGEEKAVDSRALEPRVNAQRKTSLARRARAMPVRINPWRDNHLV